MEQQRLHTSFSKICEYAEQYALDRESENTHDMRSHYASADPHDLHASAAECSFIAQLAQTVDARTVIAIGSDNEMEVQYLTETLPSGSLITVVNAHSKTGPGMRNSYSPARSNTNNVKLRIVTADINEYLPRLNENDYDMVILGNGAGDPQQIAAASSRLLRPQGVLLITDVLALRSRTSNGGVINPADRSDHTVSMRDLIARFSEAEDYTSVLLPVGSGILFCTRQ